MGDVISWEDAVRWFRRQPGNEQGVLDNFFDLPVLSAAVRFSKGEEFREMLRLLGPGCGRRVLDLGAGHGVTSYALARTGWEVIALEPDPSKEVGHGAIENWSREAGLSVEILTDPALPFPIETASMDAVIARQVLHHVPDLQTCLRELARILKPGGILLTTRDHVADDADQLERFLAAHPLHPLYGGENAHPLEVYLTGFCAAGFELREVWGPVESVLNFFPGTEAERRNLLVKSIRNGGDNRVIKALAFLPIFQRRTARKIVLKDRTPGRIYSILARKPKDPAHASHAPDSIACWLPARKRKVSRS